MGWKSSPRLGTRPPPEVVKKLVGRPVSPLPSKQHPSPRVPGRTPSPSAPGGGPPPPMTVGPASRSVPRPRHPMFSVDSRLVAISNRSERGVPPNNPQTSSKEENVTPPKVIAHSFCCPSKDSTQTPHECAIDRTRKPFIPCGISPVPIPGPRHRPQSPHRITGPVWSPLPCDAQCYLF